MRFIFATILSCALLVACSSFAPSNQSDIRPPIELPITLRHNLPTARVYVAGVPLDLFLDLGGHNAISLTAEELAQTKVQFVSPPDHYQNAAGEVFVARRFVAPDVVIGKHPFGALDGNEYVHPPTGGPPDRNGYIGKALLTKYLLVLDYPNHRVLLYDPRDLTAFRLECGLPQFRIVDAEGAISSIGDTVYGQLKFNWDTGATDNFIRRSAIGGVGVSAAQKLDDGPPILSAVSVRLGSTNVDTLSFRLSQSALPPVDGTFGSGLFAKWKVCFDFVNGFGATVRSSR